MSPSLDENEQKELEGEITEQELLKCLKQWKIARFRWVPC